jgi:hypothetical protein
MIRKIAVGTLMALAMLAVSTPVTTAEPTEHWRCGPYDVRIIPGDGYVPGVAMDTDTEGDPQERS